jgi:outer membrane protein
VKNLSLILNGLLAVAVGVLFYLHFSSARYTSAPKTALAVDSLGNALVSEEALGDSAIAYLPDSLPLAGNVAFLNFDELTSKYQFYKDGVKSLESDFKAKQNELVARQKKLEEDFMRYQQLAPSMNEETRAGKEQQLAADEKKLYEFRDQLEGTFAGKEAEFNKAFLTKLDGYFSKLGKEKNYDYVFVYSKGGPSYIVYANDKLNITNFTLQGLNSQYKKK